MGENRLHAGKGDHCMNRFSLVRLLQRNRVLKVAPSYAVMFVLTLAFSHIANAQGQDDPPGRVGRLGYMEGSVSFQPAGESEWVEAVRNRPMTTGDKLWADRDSRAEVQLGGATIDLAPNTGFSFLNLDDRTVQIELSAGAMNVRVWGLDRDNVFEIDTPNQAFTVERPGRYRVESSEKGDYTVVTIRDGEGESTGNGQSYTIHSGQRVTFSGTNSLNAEVQQIGAPDSFDRWSQDRERRYEDSPSARYCSREVVGFEDLDEYGDWRPASEYGYVWYPRVHAGWAPYREGHWAWIDPWGWTWVDDDHWGYAPFHYGRWVFIGSRWGWIPGPREVRPVYAPALVAFVGGVGIGIGGNVAWFPLGPREVYVPSYRVSPAYVKRVNVTNTTVNVTQVTNVYNTTIVNNNTTIKNVRYVNRNVKGAVTAVPQHTFANAQPVERSAVVVNQRQIASVPVSARAAVPPAREAVLGPHANTANRVAAPPQAIANRTVIAKAAPPPPPPSFSARQQVLAQHPGQPVPRQEMQRLAPQVARNAQPRVRVAPPARPATPTPAPNRPNQPENQPGTPPAANERPGAQPVPNNRPEPNRPQPNQPAPNRPEPNQPAPNNRPEPNNNRPEPNNAQPNRPFEPPSRTDRPPSAQPNNRPEPNNAEPNNRPNQPAPNNRPEPNNSRPEPNNAQPNRPSEPPTRSDRPPSVQPNRPEPNQPAPNNRPEARQPEPNRPQPSNRPDMNRPEPRPEPSRSEPRNQAAPPQSEHQQPRAQQQERPAPQPQREPARPSKKDEDKDKNKPQK